MPLPIWAGAFFLKEKAMKRLKKREPLKSPWLWGGVLAAAVLFFAGVGIFVPYAGESAETPEPQPEAGVDLGSGLSVVQVGRYSGLYVEDGSDEIVQDVLAVTVENTGEQTLRLAHITVTDTAGTQYAFELTTLPPGEKLIALELSRAPSLPDLSIADIRLDEVILFDQPPTLQEDVLSFACTQSNIGVKNISEERIAGGHVFYKQDSGSALVGGITFMVAIPELHPGEEVSLYAGHYYEGASRLMFATCEK